MTRSYTNQDLVILPILGSSDTIVLIMTLDTAYTTREQALASSGQSIPASIARSRGRLMTAGAALSSVLQPQSIDTQAAVSADGAIDDAWGAFHSWLTGWRRLPASRLMSGAAVSDLHDLLFGQGLSFLKLAYRNQWQASQSRLEVIGQERHRATVALLGGLPFLENLLEAHMAYGAALGITAPTADGSVERREALKAALDALRDYVVKVQASIEPDDAATAALADALLAPLMEWEAKTPASSSEAAGSNTGSDAPAPEPAGP